MLPHSSTKEWPCLQLAFMHPLVSICHSPCKLEGTTVASGAQWLHLARSSPVASIAFSTHGDNNTVFYCPQLVCSTISANMYTKRGGWTPFCKTTVTEYLISCLSPRPNQPQCRLSVHGNVLSTLGLVVSGTETKH